MYSATATVCADVKKAKKIVGRPACKHCENMNMPSDHWLRSLDGSIACPRLLATECRYCHSMGHTIKKCNILQAKNSSRTSGRLISMPTGSNVLTDTDSEDECMRVVPLQNTSWNGKSTFAQIIQSMPVSNPVTHLSLIHPDDLEEPEYYPESPIDPPPRNACSTPFANLRSFEYISESDDE
jgi:hypothetical protein